MTRDERQGTGGSIGTEANIDEISLLTDCDDVDHVAPVETGL
jgi:hypothetical protein